MFTEQRLISFARRVGQEFKASYLEFRGKLGDLNAMPTVDKTVAGAIAEVYGHATGPVAASRITGVLDPSVIPAFAAIKARNVSVSTIADLSEEDQALIGLTGEAAYNAVRLATGLLYSFNGGSKTDVANYTPIADLTPSWTVIEDKPSVFPSDLDSVSGLRALEASINAQLAEGVGKDAQQDAALSALTSTDSAHEIALSALTAADALHSAALAAQAAEISGLTSRVTTTEGKDATQDSQISNLQGDVSNLESVVSGQTSQISGLQSDVTTLQGNVQSQAATNATQNGNISALQASVSTLETNVSGMASELSDVQGEVDSLQSASTDLYGVTSGLSAQIATLQSQVGAIDVATVANGLSALDAGTVKHNAAQNLTAGQKGQARANIGAASSAELDAQITRIDANIDAINGLSEIVADNTDRLNIHDAVVANLTTEEAKAVKFTEQALTTEQKAQARQNIGASSAAEMSAVQAFGARITQSETDITSLLSFNAFQNLSVEQQAQARANIGAMSIIPDVDMVGLFESELV